MNSLLFYHARYDIIALLIHFPERSNCMNEPRKQHYVPQVYLRNFSYETKKNPKLYVFSKSTGKLYPANVSDTAAERDFYTIDSLENKYIWEKHYSSEIEPVLGELIKKIRSQCDNALIQDRSLILTQEEKLTLALSMLFQLSRGKQARAFTQNLYDQLLPGVAEQARTKFGPLSDDQEALLQSFAEENKYFKEIAMAVSFRRESIERIVSILVQRSFVIYKITDSYSFITSDNPVLFIDKDTFDATPFKNGLTDVNTLVYYPISPRLLIAAYHPDLFFGEFNKLDCRLVILDGTQNSRFIHTINKKQKEQSNYAYAQTREVLKKLL